VSTDDQPSPMRDALSDPVPDADAAVVLYGAHGLLHRVHPAMPDDVGAGMSNIDKPVLPGSNASAWLCNRLRVRSRRLRSGRRPGGVRSRRPRRRADFHHAGCDVLPNVHNRLRDASAAGVLHATRPLPNRERVSDTRDLSHAGVLSITAGLSVRTGVWRRRSRRWLRILSDCPSAAAC
jgi:hypothetical protein